MVKKEESVPRRWFGENQPFNNQLTKIITIIPIRNQDIQEKNVDIIEMVMFR